MACGVGISPKAWRDIVGVGKGLRRPKKWKIEHRVSCGGGEALGGPGQVGLGLY